MPDTSAIRSYHAHVYFDAATRASARALREAVEAQFDVQMGRWHEKPVGPHPRWSYQIAFEMAEFDRLVPWLMLNKGELQILLHPNTGDDLADHTVHACWLGPSTELNTAMFKKKAS